MIACILEGEAGALGEIAMVGVGDTMLSRKASEDFPNSWERTMSAYYACEEPSEEALEIARIMVFDPWKPSGYVFVYSDQDRYRMGWLRGQMTITSGRLCLHFRRDWPGG